jgi:uncharacterized protein (TIGR02300 family)
VAFSSTKPIPLLDRPGYYEGVPAAVKFWLDTAWRSWQLAAAKQGRAKENSVAKPEWGTKRLCTSCGARFYDLNRQPIECPKCHTVIDPDQVTRLKRSRSAVPEEVVKAKPVKPVEVDAELAIEGEAEIEDVDEDEDVVLEDASDLTDDEEFDEFVDDVDPAKEKDAD